CAHWESHFRYWGAGDDQGKMVTARDDFIDSHRLWVLLEDETHGRTGPTGIERLAVPGDRGNRGERRAVRSQNERDGARTVEQRRDQRAPPQRALGLGK